MILLDINNNIYNDNNIISNISLNTLFNDLNILNLIIYGYKMIQLNINNKLFTKTIFKCLVLCNNIENNNNNDSYFYCIDIIEDYFALIKYNNVNIYNISLNLTNIKNIN